MWKNAFTADSVVNIMLDLKHDILAIWNETRCVVEILFHTKENPRMGYEVWNKRLKISSCVVHCHKHITLHVFNKSVIQRTKLSKYNCLNIRQVVLSISYIILSHCLYFQPPMYLLVSSLLYFIPVKNLLYLLTDSWDLRFSPQCC